MCRGVVIAFVCFFWRGGEGLFTGRIFYFRYRPRRDVVTGRTECWVLVSMLHDQNHPTPRERTHFLYAFVSVVDAIFMFDVSTCPPPPRYGVPYGVSQTPDNLLQAWRTPGEAIERSLKLPGPNVYIPDDFSLVCDKQVEAAAEGSDSGGSARKEKGNDGDNSNSISISDDGAAMEATTKAVVEGRGAGVFQEQESRGEVCLCVFVRRVLRWLCGGGDNEGGGGRRSWGRRGGEMCVSVCVCCSSGSVG